MKLTKLIEQLKFIRLAAIDAGIWDYVFLAFGSCLGAVREGGFIGHDNDADIGILADKITKEQEETFYKRLWDYKLFEKRHKEMRRNDTGRLVWCSLKMAGAEYKTCVWFMWQDFDMMWHSKASNWSWKIGQKLQPPPSPNTEAIAKGIPAKWFEPLANIEWYKQDWKIPMDYGHCLDAWYPNWNIPKRGGSSREDYLLIIPKWSDKKNWFIRRR